MDITKPEEQKASEIVEQKGAEHNKPEDIPDILHVTIEDGKPTPDIESMCMYCHQ